MITRRQRVYSKENRNTRYDGLGGIASGRIDCSEAITVLEEVFSYLHKITEDSLPLTVRVWFEGQPL